MSCLPCQNGFFCSRILSWTCNLSLLMQCFVCLAKVIFFTAKYYPELVTSRPWCVVLLALPKWFFYSRILSWTCNLSFLMQCPSCFAKVIFLIAEYCPEPVTSRPWCTVLPALPKCFFIAKYCPRPVTSRAWCTVLPALPKWFFTAKYYSESVTSRSWCTILPALPKLFFLQQSTVLNL